MKSLKKSLLLRLLSRGGKSRLEPASLAIKEN
ncbi:hypothetical protein SMU98_08225 [Streptococcus mutans SM1]|nr:hypothetical protein SMU9_08657 [Streptococcus mutans 1ID3]EMC03330.1 hypothetical protein SMU70_09524 [Streptococcus mutans NLML5]EMC42205.1 hypothetical protein SMU98_08225 [Streptococcus mutans SM1]